MYCVIYEIVTGKIVRVIQADRSQLIQQIGIEEALLIIQQLIDDTLYYVYQGELLLRPTPEIVLSKQVLTADGVDKIILANLPKGVLSITERETRNTITVDVHDSDEFYTTIPGTYDLQLAAFPYLDFTTTIKAI